MKLRAMSAAPSSNTINPWKRALALVGVQVMVVMLAVAGCDGTEDSATTDMLVVGGTAFDAASDSSTCARHAPTGSTVTLEAAPSTVIAHPRDTGAGICQ
jgi:hypothetical protein